MTPERMLELIILTNLMERYVELPTEAYQLAQFRYAIESMEARRKELENEFLEPYVIDNAEKSE